MSQAPGWYSDPFFRGQERYWDGKMWTQGTRLGGTEAEAGAEESTASVEQQPVHPYGVNPGFSAPVPSVPSTPPGVVSSAGETSFAPLGAPVASVAAASPTWAPPMVGTANPGGSGLGRQERQRRRAIFGIGAAALVLVVGGISAALVLGGSSNASAEEALSNAATQTINAQSADMSLTVDVNFLGMHETVSANGAFDFAHKTGTMTMTIPVGGKQYTQQEILDGSTVYVNISGLESGLASGKPWVSVNSSQIGSSNSGLNTLDPTSIIQKLQSIGGTVTSLGPTTYQGTPVTEYAATVPASALDGEIGSLGSSLGQAASGLNLPDMHLDIYVTQDNLLQAIALPSYSFSVAGQSISMDMTLALSNYGTTVNVTPPPADEVEPLSQLGGGLGNSGSTGSTGTTGSTGNTGASI